MLVYYSINSSFEKVPNMLLMNKLSKVRNINSKLLMWIHDFLSNRTQRVVVAQNRSSEIQVTPVLGVYK